MQAIYRFSEARPPGIYKQDYINDLYNLFGEQIPENFVCPQTPEWKRSPDRDDDDDDGNTVLANAVGTDEMGYDLAPSEMTNDDVLGDPVPFNQIESMRQFCNQVLKLNVRVSILATYYVYGYLVIKNQMSVFEVQSFFFFSRSLNVSQVTNRICIILRNVKD